MIDAKAIECFWQVVKACLMEFHSLSEPEAVEKSTALRRRIESAPTGMSSDIFYHAEPFYVACDIVEKDLDLSEHWERYSAMLAVQRW